MVSAGATTEGSVKPSLATRWYDDFVTAMRALNGKNVAITGTTTGTGFIAARTLASKGANVFLLNRASERAAASLAAVRDACTGDGAATQIDCDLQDFASVRAAAASLEKELASSQLYALINNAGVMALPERATKDGYDVQMQTNHLSHFLLSSLMMPALERSAASCGEARIVNHSSAARNSPDTPLEKRFFEQRVGELDGDEGGRWMRYHMSKLANSIFTFALDAKLKERGSKVKALVCHPGVCDTDLVSTTVREAAVEGDAERLEAVVATGQTAEDGTLPLLAAAVNPDACSGDLYGPWMDGDDVPMIAGQPILGPPKRLTEPETLSRDKSSQRMLWEASEAAVGQPFFA